MGPRDTSHVRAYYYQHAICYVMGSTTRENSKILSPDFSYAVIVTTAEITINSVRFSD